jgi:hypothetical protein
MHDEKSWHFVAVDDVVIGCGIGSLDSANKTQLMQMAVEKPTRKGSVSLVNELLSFCKSKLKRSVTPERMLCLFLFESGFEIYDEPFVSGD